jgi:threonine/homoserine/homoserine lactone efflux protein
MLSAFLNGAILGLVLAILVGPIFFVLLDTSIQKGFFFGFLMAIGILISDTLYIIITYTGLAQLINNDSFKNILGVGGGAIMIIAGITSMLKKKSNNNPTQQIKEVKKTDHYSSIFKGFILNTMNPAVLIFWIGAVSYVTIDLKYSNLYALSFFLGTLTITFTTDLGKSYVAQKISKIITPLFILWLNRIAGLALTLFGIKLIAEVVIPMI